MTSYNLFFVEHVIPKYPICISNGSSQIERAEVMPLPSANQVFNI